MLEYFFFAMSTMLNFVSKRTGETLQEEQDFSYWFWYLPFASCSYLTAASFMLAFLPVALTLIKFLWHMCRQLLIKFQ